MALEHIDEVPSFKMDGTEFELQQIPEGQGRSSVKTYLELKRSVTWGNELLKELNNMLVEIEPALKTLIDEPRVKQRLLEAPKAWLLVVVSSVFSGAAAGLIEKYYNK